MAESVRARSGLVGLPVAKSQIRPKQLFKLKASPSTIAPNSDFPSGLTSNCPTFDLPVGQENVRRREGSP